MLQRIGWIQQEYKQQHQQQFQVTYTRTWLKNFYQSKLTNSGYAIEYYAQVSYNFLQV